MHVTELRMRHVRIDVSLADLIDWIGDKKASIHVYPLSNGDNNADRDDRVVAVVGGHSITVSDVVDHLSQKVEDVRDNSDVEEQR